MISTIIIKRINLFGCNYYLINEYNKDYFSNSKDIISLSNNELIELIKQEELYSNILIITKKQHDERNFI